MDQGLLWSGYRGDRQCNEDKLMLDLIRTDYIIIRIGN